MNPMFLLALLACVTLGDEMFTHRTLCTVFHQRNMYLNRGMYIAPAILKIPGCCKGQNAIPLRLLLDDLKD